MIRFRHALTLANTKLKSKRFLLLISIIISSILFAVLIAGIIIFSGAEKSAVNFVAKANDGVYRVEVNPVIPASVYSYDRPLSIETIRHIRVVEKQYYANLEVEYKAAGLKYDKSIELQTLKPLAYFPPSMPEEQRFDIAMDSPVIVYDQQLKIAEYIKTAKNKLSDLKVIGEKYHASGYYDSSQTGLLSIPNMRLLKETKEDFNDNQLKSGDMSTYGYAINSIHNGTYQFQDDALLKRYLFNKEPTKKPTGIPVVVTAQEAAALFGDEKSIGEEPQDPQQKITWLNLLQEKFTGYTYQACYRNSADLAKIQKIQKDYAEIINNKDNKEFKEPKLQYSFPAEACGEVVIKKDTRNIEEKKIDLQQIEIQKKLGTYIEPQRKLLTFEIVGIILARPYSQYTTDIQSYLKNLLAADNYNMVAYIPRQAYEQLPLDMKFINDTTEQEQRYSALTDVGLSTHVLDFKNIDEARAFMTNETCPSIESSCNKLFTSSPYGSNYLILQEIGKAFRMFMLYAMPVVLGLAAIIIWFTMVRVMSENRKEIAVYRAMGAKRIDIILIYLTYGMIIAFRIALVSLGIGILTAFILDLTYGQQLSAVASASFGTNTEGIRFSLFDLSSPYLYIIILSIFSVSLLAIIQPLISSVRRSPILDIRNE